MELTPRCCKHPTMSRLYKGASSNYMTSPVVKFHVLPLVCNNRSKNEEQMLYNTRFVLKRKT